MNLDDRICYCYHVSLRKLLNFARREKPARPSQMSECLGAGTGCGWCIPVLRRIHEQATLESASSGAMIDGLPSTPEEYAAARQKYISCGQAKNRF